MIFTKRILLLLFVFIAVNASAQHSLKKLWATDTVFNNPESVLLEKDVMYVSVIDGAPWGRDGKGEVAQLTKQGKNN